MAGLLLWSQTDLEDEITAEVAIRFLDDDRTGAIDAAPLLRLQERSAGYVISGLQHAYPQLITAITAWQADLDNVPERLRSLALNVAIAYLAKRHPEVIKLDWKSLMDHADASIARIRKEGLDSLGIETTPEPAANHGGTRGGGTDDDVTLTVSPYQYFNGPLGTSDF